MLNNDYMCCKKCCTWLLDIRIICYINLFYIVSFSHGDLAIINFLALFIDSYVIVNFVH